MLIRAYRGLRRMPSKVEGLHGPSGLMGLGSLTSISLRSALSEDTMWDCLGRGAMSLASWVPLSPRASERSDSGRAGRVKSA